MADTKDVCATTFADDVRAATTRPPLNANIGRSEHTSHADGTSYSTAQMAPVLQQGADREGSDARTGYADGILYSKIGRAFV